MGVVYEVHDQERGQRVALKALRHPDADQIYRLKREFRALADLSDPHLVSLYELFVEEDACYFTMQLVTGVPFLEYCGLGGGGVASSQEKPSADFDAPTEELANLQPNASGAPTGAVLACNEQRLRRVLPQLAQGLHALHRAGKVHRDVKPSNALVDKSGHLVLLDFGLVGDAAQSGYDSLVGQVVGTAEYMSPEQAAAGGALTPGSDWYSFGVILFHASTGRLPFTGGITEVLYAKLHEEARAPRSVLPTVPEDLDDLCKALLSRKPRDRPTGVEVLLRLGVDPRSSDAQALAPNARASDERPPFAGRREELQSLERAFARVEGGQPAIVRVRGPSGIGKSELVHEFLARSRLSVPNMVVLSGRCYEHEAVPFKAIDPLIDHLSRVWMQLPERDAHAILPRSAAVLPKLFPVLGRVPAVANTRGQLPLVDPQDLRLRGFSALREVLQRLGERRRLVLFLDNMQWVDSETVGLLSELMRPPDAPALLLLVCMRGSAEDSAFDPEDMTESLGGVLLTSTSDEIRSSERRRAGGGTAALERMLIEMGTAAESIELGPLSKTDARRLCEKLLGGADPDKARYLVREAGGNPFFLVELARYAQSVGPGELRAVRLDDVLEHRISRLSPERRRVLDLVAIAGEPISRRVLATAAELEREALDREIQYLRVNHLVRTAGGRRDDNVEPYHPKIREAVVAAVFPQARAERHEALVLAYEQWAEASPDRLARHWLGAGHRIRAGEHAREAAAQAMAKLDFDRAAVFYQMILALGELDEDEQRSLLIRLGNAESAAGRPWEAANAFRSAAESADAAERLDLRRRSAEQLLLGGYLDEGLDAIREVLAEVGLKLARSQRRALYSVLWQRAWLKVRGMGFEPRDESRIPRRELTKVDACRTVASVLAVVDHIRGADFQVRQLRLALRLGEPKRVSRALALEAVMVSATGGYERALAMASRARDVSDDPLGKVYATWAEGAALFFGANEWQLSLAKFQAALTQFRTHGAGASFESGTCEIYECFNLLHLGELLPLAARVASIVRDAERRGDRYSSVTLRTRLNLIWLARDDPKGAERDLEGAIASWTPWTATYQVQHFYGLFGRCELELYRENSGRAAEYLEEQLAALRASQLMRVWIVRTEASYLRGRVAVAVAASGKDRESNLRLAAKLAGDLAKQRSPVAQALSMLLRASIARVRGDEGSASALLRRALPALEARDTLLLENAARRRLGETLGGDEGTALIAHADEWMAGQRVRNPARLASMLVPGWPSRDG